ncbi:MAG: hypothetical protein ACOZF0_21115 [Thermodesulfobacteriota bacterium]
MTTSPLIRMGIDIGFGDVKAVAGRITENGRIDTDMFKFPSAVARIRKKAVAGLDDAQVEYGFENQKYLAGNDALISANLIPSRDMDFIMEFSPLLIFKAFECAAQIYHLPVESLCHSVEVCLGLPLAYYMDKKDELARRLARFEISGQEVTFTRIGIQAQSQGILLDFLFDEHCRPNRKWLGSDLLILDIGFNTIDILCVHEGRSSSEWSNMLEGAGLCRICRELDIELKKTGLELPEQAVKNALEHRRVSIYGRDIDLSATIAQLSRDYADFLYREIKSRLSDVLKNTRKLIVAGGGAYYVAPFFREKFPDDFLTVPVHAEFSNARGYYKYLKGVKNG